MTSHSSGILLNFLEISDSKVCFMDVVNTIEVPVHQFSVQDVHFLVPYCMYSIAFITQTCWESKIWLIECS